MKRSTLTLLSLLLFTCLTISCSKKDELQPEIQIDEKNLTDCPANTTCTYYFTETDIFSPNAPYGTSDNRMFYAQATTSVGSITLSIETPRQVNSFLLTADDIKNGKVKIQNSCQTCNYIGYKLIGGSVKGINLSKRDTRPSGSVKWLIEAKIVRELLVTPAQVDTFYVKQYFYPVSPY